MDTKNQASKKPREKNIWTEDDRVVRKQLFAAVEPMGEWQREAAHLKAIRDKAGASEDTDARALTLRAATVEARTNVDEIIERLPDRLRKHSRVTDIVGALERLEALIARI